MCFSVIIILILILIFLFSFLLTHDSFIGTWNETWVICYESSELSAVGNDADIKHNTYDFSVQWNDRHQTLHPSRFQEEKNKKKREKGESEGDTFAHFVHQGRR